jgi:hypothetical protein
MILFSTVDLTDRRAIEQEKVVYKEGFERLRVLKPEIEHIRKVSYCALVSIIMQQPVFIFRGSCTASYSATSSLVKKKTFHHAYYLI